jgi:uncharacterized protein
MSTPWLAVAEETAERRPTYLLARDGHGVLRACLACYPLDARSPFPFCRLDLVLEHSGVEHETSQAPMPNLFCGGRFPSHTRVAVDARLGPSERRAAVEAVVDRAEEAAREQGLRSLAVLYVDEGNDILRRALEKRRFLVFASETASSLEVPATFEDYLGRLDGRRRNAVRRDRRKLADAGVELSVRRLAPELVGELVALEANLNAKYGTPFDPAAARAGYDALLRSAPEHALVATAEIEGRICGFVLLLRWRDELYARQVGFDYERQGSLPVYFGVVFYEPIGYAIREGLARIDYATGAQGTKRTHGCSRLGQYAYVRCFDDGLHARLARELTRARG